MKVKKAVIPVAGYGTRFLPVTKSVPKELLPIVDRPTLQYVVEEVLAAGIEQILFVTSVGKYSIEDYFDRNIELEAILEKKKDYDRLEMIRNVSQMLEINTVRQKEQKGLGHAISMAREFVGREPFAVLLGDDIIDSEKPAIGQMMEVAEKHDKAVIALDRVPWDKAHRYGIVDPEPIEPRVCRIKEMIEKPAKPPSNLAIIGRYILPPEIFEIIDRTEPGKGGEIQITDAIITLNGPNSDSVYGYEYEGIRHDGGEIFGFLRANIAYALKRPELRDKLLALFAEVLDQQKPQ